VASERKVWKADQSLRWVHVGLLVVDAEAEAHARAAHVHDHVALAQRPA